MAPAETFTEDLTGTPSATTDSNSEVTGNSETEETKETETSSNFSPSSSDVETKDESGAIVVIPSVIFYLVTLLC